MSAVCLTITGLLFVNGVLTAVTITIGWTITFFCASPAASAAYLTSSEIFPLETRAMVIAFVFAVGTLLGGVAAPAIFGALIASGSAQEVFNGYLFGSALMVIAAVVALWLGVNAEGKSLEEIAPPLTSEEAPAVA
jgi:MFS family permease